MDEGGWEEEPLPSELSSAGAGSFLELSRNRLSVRAVGPEGGAVQAQHPVPRPWGRPGGATPGCGGPTSAGAIYYFEVTVRDAGERGSVTVGFSDRHFKQQRGAQPGSEPGSWGYRGDQGRKFAGAAGRGEPYGPAFGAGETVGAGLHLGRREIFFTKDGVSHGVAFTHVTPQPLYPTVGLHSHGAWVEANFGQRPFRFDIEGMRQREERAHAQAVASVPVDTAAVHLLVRGFLQHYGYAATLAEFDAASGTGESAGRPGPAGPGAAAATDAAGGSAGAALGGARLAGAAAGLRGLQRRRAELRARVMAGDVDGVEAVLASSYGIQGGASDWLEDSSADLAARPGALHAKAAALAALAGALFELRRQRYFERVRRGDVDGALRLLPDMLGAPRGTSAGAAAQEAAARDAAALLAYEDPMQSPLAHLLGAARRDAAADAADAALVALSSLGPEQPAAAASGAGPAGGQGAAGAAPGGGSRAGPALEALLRQLGAAGAALAEAGGGSAGRTVRLRDHL